MWALFELLIGPVGFVLTAGLLFPERFRKNYFVVGIACLLAAGSSWLTIEEFWKRRNFAGTEASDLTKTSTAVPATTPLPVEPSPKPRVLESPPPIQIPTLKPDAAAQARMSWGTLPPNGEPAVLYSITNTSANSLKDVSASVWIVEGNYAKKLDERRIGYIGRGEFREVQSLVPATPYGRGLLCISFGYGGRGADVVHFFESAGPYAKYGPMREMQRFRDPIVSDKVGGLCQSAGANAAALIKQ